MKLNTWRLSKNLSYRDLAYKVGAKHATIARRWCLDEDHPQRLIPNTEGTRHVSFKMKLKSFGTRSGWPDLEIFCPNTKPIFIELKRPDAKGRAKGVLSHNQRLLKEQFENLGVHWAMCKSLEDVVNFLSPLVRLKGGERYVDMVRGK